MAAETNPAVEIALKAAMDTVIEAMRPWQPASGVLARLRDDFRDDFADVIAKTDDYDAVVNTFKRVFRFVGTAGAMIAEAQVPGTQEPRSREVTYLELAQACKLVEIAICPRPDPEGPRLRLCRVTPILEGEVGAEAALVALVVQRYDEYKTHNQHAMGSPHPTDVERPRPSGKRGKVGRSSRRR